MLSKRVDKLETAQVERRRAAFDRLAILARADSDCGLLMQALEADIIGAEVAPEVRAVADEVWARAWAQLTPGDQAMLSMRC